MVNYKCYQCGYDSNKKSNFLNHLSRKNPCKILLNEITINENLTKNNIDIKTLSNISSKTSSIILKKLEKHPQLSSKNNKNNICKFCSKTLSNYKNKWRHEKTCKGNVTLSKLEELTAQNNELLKMVHKLNRKPTGNNNNNTNSNNTNSNNTINIKVNNFDEERIDYFTEKLGLKLAKNYNGMITKFVNLLHFNEKHPENHTIRIKDRKSGLGEIREKDDWKFVGMNHFLDKVHENLIDKLGEIREIINDENISRFDKWYAEVQDLIGNELIEKGIKQRIKVASINGTNKLHKK